MLSRTHRERKELYVKSLEDEVVRLKDVYGTAVVHREQAVTENKKLRAILAKHGIAGPPAIRVTPTQPPQSQEQSQEQPQKQPQKQQAPTNGLPEIKSQPMVNGAGLHSSVQSAGV